MNEDQEESEDEFPLMFYQRKGFFPKIFDSYEKENIPEGFNCVKVHIDGKIRSSLDWSQARNEAKSLIERGYYVFWEMDLGLFDGCLFPLANQMQYLSLKLSLEQFKETLWEEFKNSTFGLSLYRGPLDFSVHFPWDEEQIKNLRGWLQDKFLTIQNLNDATQLAIASFEDLDAFQLEKKPYGKHLLRMFCSNVCIDYLRLMTSHTPEGLNIYLLLDANGFIEPAELAHLISKDRFERLNIAIKQEIVLSDCIAWGCDHPLAFGYIGEDPRALTIPTLNLNIGVCLPPYHSMSLDHLRHLNEALKKLKLHKISFKLISEEYLTSEWEGLDFIIVLSNGMSNQGKRKLQGFCAAGGTIVTIGDLLYLNEETSFEEWIKDY